MALRRYFALCIRRRSILVTAGLLCLTTLEGQSHLQGRTYYQVAAKSYGIEDGMPDKCVEYAFTDTTGRLKVIPCTHVQASQEIYLYQFDGRRAYRQFVPIIQSTSQLSLVRSQTTDDGMFYGYLVEYRDGDEYNTVCFSYRPDEDKWDTITPPSVDGMHTVIRSLRVCDSVIYVLAYTPGAFHIFSYEQGQWNLQASLDVPRGSGPARISIPFDVDARYFWIGEWYGQVHRVDRATLQYQSIERDTLETRFNFAGAFIRLAGERLLYCARPQGKLFLPDFAAGELNDFIPGTDPPASVEATTHHYAFKDNSGNVLFVRYTPDQPYLGWLHEADGTVSDYSHVLKALRGHDVDEHRQFDLISDDFTKALFVIGNEFVAVEVAAQGAVQPVSTLAMRGVMELSDSVLVFARNMIFDGKQVSMDLTHPAGCFDQLQVDGDIVRLDADRFAYFLRGKGITVYNITTADCQIVFDSTRIHRIATDGHGLIYTLASNRLFAIDPVTRAAEMIVDTVIRSFVSEVFIDTKGDLYLASSDGLSYVNSETSRLESAEFNPGRQDEPVLSIYEDHSGRLWLGTHGAGLILYDPRDGTSRSITEDEGLSSNIVASTIEDPQGDIWVGTYYGITIFDQEANILGYLFEEGGLVDNECNRWAASVLNDGRLYFGSTEGFSLIDPVAVKRQIAAMDPLHIYATVIEFDGQTLVNGEHSFTLGLEDGITIPASNRSLRIAYGLSSYASPGSNRFAYKLDLPGNTWNFVGALYQLNLSDLPTGQYDLLIKGTDFRGRVSSNVITVPLNVRRYFYTAWWFYILCALPFAVFAFLWIRRQRSERRRLEREVDKRTQTIREQTEELKELDMHKTRLYTNITHEFRTPLTVIRGLIDRVEEDHKAPELIKRNTDSLLNLVNQMLDLRKLESGNLTYDPVQDNIVPYLQYIGESFRSLAEGKSQRFHFLTELRDLEMDYDPDKLARVIANLLSNAIKFTPAGGDVYLQVEGARLDDGVLDIKVIDTGIGIPEAQLGKIFDRFYQVDNSHLRRGEGTGIGLTLVSEFVKLMGGSIRVFSKQGSGTTFVISLPITHEAKPAEGATFTELAPGLVGSVPLAVEEPTNRVRAAGSEKPRVLIVEDNPDVVHYIGGCLKDDYQLMIAMDGQEGIDKALDQVPDIIVSDVMMPEKDGFELCEIVKNDERTSHIPLILLTAKADSESRLQGLSRGADAYLAKPFDKNELLIRLSVLIEQREMLQKRYAGTGATPAPSDDPDVQIEDSFIAKVNEILIAHLDDEHFGIDELCDAVHLGRTQLHNKLKALTGKSTGIYIRAVRISQSVRFLEDPEFNISEVAYAVGFGDPKYYARIFKQEFGVTPSEWREKASPPSAG